MLERMFEFVAAAADELFAAVQFHDIGFFDGIAGFAGGMSVHAHLSGHHGTLRLLAALTQAALDEHLIQSDAHRTTMHQGIIDWQSVAVPRQRTAIFLLVSGYERWVGIAAGHLGGARLRGALTVSRRL